MGNCRRASSDKRFPLGGKLKATTIAGYRGFTDGPSVQQLMKSPIRSITTGAVIAALDEFHSRCSSRMAGNTAGAMPGVFSFALNRKLAAFNASLALCLAVQGPTMTPNIKTET